MGSIYSGYHPGPGTGSVITGTLYGLVDGAIGGAVFWLAVQFPVGEIFESGRLNRVVD
jgi:hypothetical protein